MTSSLFHQSALTLALAAWPASAFSIAVAQADTRRVEALIVQRSSDLRREHGVAPVTRDAKLQKAAEDFAAFMARTGKYGHEADGTTAGKRARAAGYEWCDIAENIAYQFDSRGFETDALARKVLDGWKASPGHRANILAPEVTHIAVAVARNARTGYYYTVQMFGRPC